MTIVPVPVPVPVPINLQNNKNITKIHDGKKDTTKACLSHNENESLITNKFVKKWQNSNYLKPGQRLLHPALREDFKEGHADKLIFGRPLKRNLEHKHRSFHDPHVEDILGGATSSTMPSLSSVTRSNMIGKYVGGEECQAIKHDLNEKKVYKSAKCELGRSFHRGHVIPEFMKDNNYRYGLKTKKSEDDAKALLYPNYSEIDDKCSPNSNGSKAHATSLPGQQRKRDYHWPIDPITTVFGVKGQDANGRCSSKGVSEALHHNISVAGMQPQRIHGQKNSTFDTQKETWKKESPIFGKATPSKAETAADCLISIHVQNNLDQMEDLGKSVRPGFRNAITKERRFGCPSIRTDIPKYERHSVADTQNYGDDVNAEYLLRPTQCASFGIDTDEFHKPRTKEYIQTLFQECGYDPMCEDDFDAIWEKKNNKIGFMTISQFQDLYNTWFMKQMKSVGN